MRKRILALVTAACMVLSLAPAALADTAGSAVDVETYASTDTVYTVTFPSDTTGYTLYEVDTADDDALSEITGSASSVLAGDDLTFAVDVDDAYASASDVWVYADNELLTADEDGYYTISAVTADTEVVICGVSTETPSYHTVTLPSDSSYYDVYAVNIAADETQVIDGGIYGVEVVLADGITGTYTVTANGTTVTADENGIYWVTDVSADLTIDVTGSFTTKVLNLDLEYDDALYSVTVDGESAAGGSILEVDYGSAVQLTVSLLSASGIKVVLDSTSILTADSSSDTDGDGTVDTYVYSIEITDDAVIRITSYSIGVKWLSYTGDLYGTAWTYGYVQGGKVLSEGDTLEFYIELLEGYTDSPLDVQARITGGGSGSLSAKKYDADTNRYYYEISDLTYGDNDSTVTSITIYVASENAVLTTSRVPIQPNTYTATYYMAEGSSTVYTTQEITYGETITAPDDPTKDGYVLKSWKNAAGKTYNFSKTVTGDISLYASWATACTVTFKLNNGKANIVKTVAQGSTVTKPSNPTKSGYIFKGWYTSDGEKFDFSTAITEDTVLTAKWKKGTAISSLKFSKVSDKVYTGKAIKPSVTIKNGSTKLVKGEDYTIKYSSNKKVGKAKITIKGKGNYAGTKTITFSILPKATKITSAKSTSKGSVTLKYKKSKTVTNYVIYRATKKNGKYTKIATTKKTSYTDKTAASGKKYYYKVAVAKKSGSIVYSSNKSKAKKVKVK